MAIIMTSRGRTSAPTSATEPQPASAPQRIALAVADVGWFTTDHLFRSMPPERASTLLLHCADVRNAWRDGERPWSWNRPHRQTNPSQWRRSLAMPTGWMKTYPRIGMRPVASAIRRWKAEHAASDPLVVAISYPYYVHLAGMLRPDALVYYAFDDYRLYWPKSIAEVDSIERRAVRQADLTVACSLHRANELKAMVPEAAHKVRHLPHGAPPASIPASPQVQPAAPPADIAHLPRPLVGFVGAMEDRVDWALLAQLAERHPEVSFVLVGRIDGRGSEPWRVDRSRCLALPNVHSTGWRAQETIDAYNRSFDLAIIPYRTDHPFNIACCPTKIMDGMAAGRPVVMTDIPECRLHGEAFDVVSPDRFLDAVSHRLATGCDDGRAAVRHRLALANACPNVAGRLLDWIAELEPMAGRNLAR
jgi:glycosyltransferase involved in cell wall biosynthesis